MKATLICAGCKYYAACGDDDRIAPCDGREIMETVIVDEMEMPLLHDIRSIFDEKLDGNFCHTGEYMVLMRDCKGNHYAMTMQDWYLAKRNGN